MSDVLFPTLAGLTWDIGKTPEFSTNIQRSVNLTEIRASFSATPVWNFKLSYDVLRDDLINNELQILVGFFLARRGSWDSFLFADPSDSAALLQSFGTGDGSETQFQLVRNASYYGETASNVAAAPAIYADGVLQSSGYAVDAAGLVTFSGAPGNGVALTWSGTYYYRCRFLKDTLELNNFMYQLWEAQSVEFVGSLGSKI